jgi:hypothetical protein
MNMTWYSGIMALLMIGTASLLFFAEYRCGENVQLTTLKMECTEDGMETNEKSLLDIDNSDGRS